MREWLRRRVVDFKCSGHWSQHAWLGLRGPGQQHGMRCIRCGTVRHVHLRNGLLVGYTYTPKTYPQGGHKL